MAQQGNLFSRLTKLFRSGPVVRRKVKNQTEPSTSSAYDMFKRNVSDVYSSTVSAYGQYDRMSRYSDFCLSGDTLIAVNHPDIQKTIKEIVDDYQNGTIDYGVFSYDDGEIKFGDIENAWCTGEREIWEVTLDNGDIVRCTDNHPFMLRNGEYKRADQLQKDDALMPFKRGKIKTGYIFNVSSKRRLVYEHCLVNEKYDDYRFKKDDGFHVHHINFSQQDNRSCNLVKMSSKDHLSYHAKINNKRFENIENRVAQSNIMSSRWSSQGDLRQNLEKNTEKRKKSEGFKESVRKTIERNKTNPPGFGNANRKDQKGIWNARCKKEKIFQTIYSAYIPGMSIQELLEKLAAPTEKHLLIRLGWAGYSSWNDFVERYTNHKVASVVRTNKFEPVYDITVKKYHNFALMSPNSSRENIQGLIFVHNSEMEATPELACITIDSVINTPAGNKTILELLELQSSNKNWSYPVYSYDEISGALVIGFATNIRKTKRSKLVEVVLDNNQSIKCTPDHLFLTRDGKWIEAQNLEPDQSLTSFERVNHKVLKVNVLDYEEDVYDLTVEKYHNFACNGVIIHNSALDIYAEETASQDETGRVLHVHSENRVIQELLTTLFDDTLNINFNLPMWVRNLCKYGDMFLFNDIDPKYGVINVYPIPISEMEREEGYDPKDPMAVRFRWITKGNTSLENWQITHFRLLGNDAFLPYGSSVLESARRIWRQLILIEDAMLVYRIVRAPERRIFYIDVGNIPPDEIENYMQQAQSSLRRNKAVDKTSGRLDLRYNPLSVDDDFFLPVRGGESGTKIESLPGGANAAAVEDVQYIQKKLFAAIKIPKAYLGYDESLGSKATLAQEDIRFSRTIARIQKVIISELNKIAMIHLYSHGFTDDELLNFKINLNNPSSVAQLQKLELIKSKFEIAGTAPEGSVDREWIRKNILGLTNEEIERIKKGREADKIEDAQVEAAELDEPEVTTSVDEPEEAAEEPAAEPEEGAAEDLFSGDIKMGNVLGEFDGFPIKPSSETQNVFGSKRKKQKSRSSNEKAEVPDFLVMTLDDRPQSTKNEPYGPSSMKRDLGERISLSNALFGDAAIPRRTPEINSMLNMLNNRIVSNRGDVRKVLHEDFIADSDGEPDENE